MVESPLTHPNLVFETAAEHVTTRVPIASPIQKMSEVRRTLMENEYEYAACVAVCEGEVLRGILKIENALSAPGEVTAGEIMDVDPPVVAPGTDQERTAWHAVRHGESALAVVDAQRKFMGFVPPQRLLEVLLWEHEEDMSRLGGYLHDTAAARRASQEPVPRRFWHRLPWLLIGLVGAVFAADIVGAFEGQLQGKVLLAFFIPGIVYLADAVGTQTETLVVRGLSLGVGIRQIAWREIITGVLIGITVALVFFPIALWRWGEADVALAVSLALLAACSMATFIAMALPWLIHRLGKDPAYGSGPLATVVQDLLSILIYFVIVTNLVE
jgi:magnesium transporter